MYQPNYRLSDRLINHLAKLEADKAVVAHYANSPTIKPRLEKRAKALNLFHLAHLLEVPMTLREVERVAEGKKVVTDDKKGTLINNFRNILEFNRSSVAGSYADVDLNLLTHLNKLLLSDWHESWEAKIRTMNESPDGEFDQWVGARNQELDPKETLNQVSEAIEWYKSNQSIVFVLIRIAVLLRRLIEISPFVFGNQLTIIGLADYLLMKTGYASKGFVPAVRGFDMAQEDYLDTLMLTKESGDMSLWIERFVRNLASDMTEVSEEFSVAMAEQEKSAKQPFLDLNKRQLKILRYLQTIPTVKREDYCQMMDVSTMTAFRDLADLVNKKLVKIEGQGRGTKYMLYNR